MIPSRFRALINIVYIYIYLDILINSTLEELPLKELYSLIRPKISR